MVRTMRDRCGKRPRLGLVFVMLLLVGGSILSACGGDGACVGSGGGILLSPVCKEDWTRIECQEWDDEGINGADWNFYSGDSCEDLGYTDRCSDGSYRFPGDC
jgi:hypothetical protein